MPRVKIGPAQPDRMTIDIEIAREQLRVGNVDGAVEKSRTTFNYLLDTGGMLWRGPAITVLVESLLARGGGADLKEAHDTIGRLEAVTEPGFVFHELPLLRMRALLAGAQGDGDSYREFVGRYRSKAAAAGFEALVADTEAAMPSPGTV